MLQHSAGNQTLYIYTILLRVFFQPNPPPPVPPFLLPLNQGGEARATQSWGLDRIDQVSSHYDSRFNNPCNLTGNGVDVYVLDIGISRHVDLRGRVPKEIAGSDITNCLTHTMYTKAFKVACELCRHWRFEMIPSRAETYRVFLKTILLH